MTGRQKGGPVVFVARLARKKNYFSLAPWRRGAIQRVRWSFTTTGTRIEHVAQSPPSRWAPWGRSARKKRDSLNATRAHPARLAARHSAGRRESTWLEPCPTREPPRQSAVPRPGGTARPARGQAACKRNHTPGELCYTFCDSNAL